MADHEVPRHEDLIEYQEWEAQNIWYKTVAEARAAWDAGPYSASTLTLNGPEGVVDEMDDQYDDWFLIRRLSLTSTKLSSPCAEPTIGPTYVIGSKKLYPATNLVGTGNPIVYVPAEGVRLYHSGHAASSGDSDEAFAAPGLGGANVDSAWDYVAGNIGFANMMYPTPQNSTGGGGNWSAVNAAAGYAVFETHLMRIGLAPDVLTRIVSGGTVRQQVRASARSGVGIDEAAQQHFATWCGRIYRPGTGFVANLWDVGDYTGSVRFSPQEDGVINRTWRATITPYADCVATDYLVIETGAQHVGPTGGGTGCGAHFTDQAEDDLPEDQTTTSDLNSWVEFCSG